MPTSQMSDREMRSVNDCNGISASRTLTNHHNVILMFISIVMNKHENVVRECKNSSPLSPNIILCIL